MQDLGDMLESLQQIHLDLADTRRVVPADALAAPEPRQDRPQKAKRSDKKARSK
jgi:hypothetical protein